MSRFLCLVMSVCALVVAISPTSAFAGSEGALEVKEGALYWVQVGNPDIEEPTRVIRRCSLFDGSTAQTIYDLGDFGQPSGLQLDPASGMLYYSINYDDHEEGILPSVIRQGRLDGSTSPETVLTLPAEMYEMYISRFVFNTQTSTFYWLPSFAASDFIWMVPLGSSAIQLPSIGGQTPTTLALDQDTGQVYWGLAEDFSCNTRPEAPKIQRANPSITSIEDVLTDLTFVSSMVVDHHGGKVFWSEHLGCGPGGIFSANLNGTEKTLLVPGEYSVSMAVSHTSGRLYWIRLSGPDRIRSAKFDGTDIQDLVMELPETPEDELEFPVTLAVLEEDNPADLNHDFIVNGLDLALLLGAWGPCRGECSADLDDNGVVNGIDLAMLLSAWG